MKKLLLIITASVLAGCATPPRWLAAMYDSNDPCQNYYKQANYQPPSWCGASNNRVYIYSTPRGNGAGNPVGYVNR